MNRKPSKNTRGINAAEKRFISWVKEQPCIVCTSTSGSIADHVKGSAFKCRDGVAPVLVGMWYVIPVCQYCDGVKTRRSHRAFEDIFGRSQGEFWLDLIAEYPNQDEVPPEVLRALTFEITGNIAQ